ncbi:MAG TPA: UDP-3-O-(3-hydroxymyristoyl)glucosamine N-acyltransferase [Thermodesulfovibrionales bacterium]|nr:UDP-3-O-(3-hydroxymyristoyl)glucosamine N-acyltransferase [Thermodesulfovibrionales bacterium]
MKLGEIATRLGGEAKGDPETDILGVAGIHDVEEGEITFLSDRRLIEACARSKASCVLVGEFIPELRKPQIIVKNPQLAFAELLALFHRKPVKRTGISTLASVSARATIGPDVSVGPFAYIADGAVIGRNTVISPGVFIGDDAVIGDDCIIYPHVTVREKAKIGNRVIIHAGSVIGSDGFGYVLEDGRHHKIPQVGGVVIGDDVEIGANVTIDRATTGDTIIGSGTKIDNLVQIAHNVKIGESSIIVAQVGIAGSSEIGNFVVLGGQVGVPDHVRISDGTMVGAQSGVLGDLDKGIYSGSPAIPHRDFLKAAALFARLPEINKRLRELEAKIKSLEEAP